MPCGFSGFFSSSGYGFDDINNGVEALWIRYGDFAQHFSVQVDFSFFKAVYELAISYTSLPAGCV
jgi:hypothetical protein